MSTQTDERVDSIEHLDYTPACQGPRHKSDPPPAQFWVDIHGCKELLACTECVQFDRAMFLKHRGFTHALCGKFFPTFDSAETVVPL